jgi:hypothetical protein
VPIDPVNETHDLVMSVFGGMGKGERSPSQDPRPHRYGRTGSCRVTVRPLTHGIMTCIIPNWRAQRVGSISDEQELAPGTAGRLRGHDRGVAH